MFNKDSSLDIYLASAGTGKTTKLLDIIDKHLEEGVPVDRIAFVTFTKKGAEVAQLRTAERFGYPLNKLKNFRTIHSMAFRGGGASREIMMDYKKYKDFGEKAGYNFGNLGLNTTEGIDFLNYSFSSKSKPGKERTLYLYFPVFFVYVILCLNSVPRASFPKASAKVRRLLQTTKLFQNFFSTFFHDIPLKTHQTTLKPIR